MNLDVLSELWRIDWYRRLTFLIGSVWMACGVLAFPPLSWFLAFLIGTLMCLVVQGSATWTLLLVAPPRPEWPRGKRNGHFFLIAAIPVVIGTFLVEICFQVLGVALRYFHLV